MTTITIIDYGGSNLKSVYKALESVSGKRVNVKVSSDVKEIVNSDKIVFPGQGAIGNCMSQLKKTGLGRKIENLCQTKPFLGICLGLQSLMRTSEEDNGTACLNLIEGEVKRFKKPSNISGKNFDKIPHMGWNNVYWEKKHPLMEGIPSGTRFYFVHSYFVKPKDPELIVGKTNYLGEFTSSIGRENIYATQFHPEKSSAAGLQLLENFVKWDGAS